MRSGMSHSCQTQLPVWNSPFNKEVLWHLAR